MSWWYVCIIKFTVNGIGIKFQIKGTDRKPQISASLYDFDGIIHMELNTVTETYQSCGPGEGGGLKGSS